MSRPKLTETGRWREWPPGSEQWAWYEPDEEALLRAIAEESPGTAANEAAVLHALKVNLGALLLPPDDPRSGD